MVELPLNPLMSNNPKISTECLTPILYVRDFAEAMKYYTDKLLFEKHWDWVIRRLSVRFVSARSKSSFASRTSNPGTWLSIFGG